MNNDDNDNNNSSPEASAGDDSVAARGGRELCATGEVRNGVSMNGVTANFVFLTEGFLGALPLTYFCIPKSARAYLLPQSIKMCYFCSGSISVDPMCPQPRDTGVSTLFAKRYDVGCNVMLRCICVTTILQNNVLSIC